MKTKKSKIIQTNDGYHIARWVGGSAQTYVVCEGPFATREDALLYKSEQMEGAEDGETC